MWVRMVFPGTKVCYQAGKLSSYWKFVLMPIAIHWKRRIGYRLEHLVNESNNNSTPGIGWSRLHNIAAANFRNMSVLMNSPWKDLQGSEARPQLFFFTETSDWVVLIAHLINETDQKRRIHFYCFPVLTLYLCKNRDNNNRYWNLL